MTACNRNLVREIKKRNKTNYYKKLLVEMSSYKLEMDKIMTFSFWYFSGDVSIAGVEKNICFFVVIFKTNAFLFYFSHGHNYTISARSPCI